MKHTNSLINSTSPYLLQHAHNPVDWHPWSEEVIQLAGKENKLILVSIGYAACHWCHVMAHESFEDEDVANVMNEHFVSIKVDREERPDVDHFYMSAVQLMSQQGGWPLNVIALPDGRPIWGGTYFPKERWIDSLLAVNNYFKSNPEKTKEYADRLQEGIGNISLDVRVADKIPVSQTLLKEAVNKWKSSFDMVEGGRLGTPKFPMPVNLEFLLYYGVVKKDRTALDFVKLTLEKMARGGIYDQVGGGFARYSVDDIWKVPHFEKMLYDNAQLLSVYSKGYRRFDNEEFKCVAYEIVDFIERELMDDSGAFYSSLDADSDGREGKFYVWQKYELRQLLQEDYPLFSEYYNVRAGEEWENGNYILTKQVADEQFAKKHRLNKDELRLLVGKWKYTLLSKRQGRTRPGLDDKTLASWNALAIVGLVDAYQAFREEHFLQLAIKNALFISGELMLETGKLYHCWKDGKASVDGFLEDYALVLKAWLALFEITGDESWLKSGTKLNNYVLDNFYDREKGFFLFSDKSAGNSIGNYFQNEDNVIPAANSVMANNLHSLYLILGQPEFLETARQMLPAIAPNFSKYPMAYANWGTFMLKLTEPYFEVVVCGINSNVLLKNLQTQFRPNILWAHSFSSSEVPLLKDRFVLDEDLIYVCTDGACQLPVRSADEALKLLDNE